MPDFSIRGGRAADLPAINVLIERAVSTWHVADRVKRLALPVYRYDTVDLDFLDLLVAACDRGIVGIAAWGDAAAVDRPPDGSSAACLHGLFIDPLYGRRGIGGRLLRAAEAHARDADFETMVVRAQRDADTFFASHGFHLNERDGPGYPHLRWKRLQGDLE